MRQSARRTRSLFVRYAVAEAIAFPGIRTEWPSFPYNEKSAREFRPSRIHSAVGQIR